MTGGTQILQPDVSITLANADRSVSNTDQKVLLVGQMLAAGSASDGVLVSNISSSGAPENALFGEASMLAAIVRAFKADNPIVQVDAIPLDDAVGTPREVTITIVGTATEAGTLVVVAGSVKLHSYDIAVADTNTETIIAAAIVTAVNADTKCPFTAANVAGIVTLTADNDGTIANTLGIETSGTIAGITGMAVAETTPGATDPTLTGILDVATSRYQAIVWPYGTATSVLQTYLDARFNATNEILDGVGFYATVDSLSDHLTALNLLNSESLVNFCDKEESETNYIGPSQNEPSYSKAAQFAAVRSLRLTPNASIATYLTSSASLDQFGGVALASLPYFNTPLPNMSVISDPRGWTRLEIEQLLTAGGSVMGVNRSGTSALVGEVKTTFKTDAASNPDPTFGFLNYVDTASNIREYFSNNLKARFAQSRLTAGSVSRGRDMANAVVIRAFCEKLYQDLAGPNFVLVQKDETSIQFFKTELSIVLDLEAGEVTIVMSALIVTQLRAMPITIKIAFSTGG